MLTKPQKIFWELFCQETRHTGPAPQADMFGTPDMADELLGLVLAGRKRATCMLARWVRFGFVPMPVKGLHSLITDGAGRPVCIIKTSRVVIKPVSNVTPHFAWCEGEGNRMLSDWLRMHRHFFRQEAMSGGFAYHDGLDAIFEEFDMIWPPRS